MAKMLYPTTILPPVWEGVLSPGSSRTFSCLVLGHVATTNCKGVCSWKYYYLKHKSEFSKKKCSTGSGVFCLLRNTVNILTIYYTLHLKI